MPDNNICILLATYNGARYVREQITSIQRQTISEWQLLVRDDGSVDGTCEIVAQIAAEDSRVTLLSAAAYSDGGAAQNFSKLMAAGLETGCQIFFLCDQDDVWEPNKLERQIGEFPERGEEQYPLLVHSDLAVVDEELRPISPSLIDHMALDTDPKNPMNYLLTRNFVTGCATSCNRCLLEQALPIPKSAIMHDWWLAMIAAMNGTIRYIHQPLVKYRQHQGNVIGAKSFWSGLNPTRNWVTGWQAGNREFLQTFRQATALKAHANQHKDWPASNIATASTYTELLQQPRFVRLKVAKGLKLRQGNLLLQLIFYVRLLTISDTGTEPEAPV